MENGILQQTSVRFRWFYGNTLNNIYSCKLENKEKIYTFFWQKCLTKVDPRGY
jgi:hypothetical protein